MSGQTDRRPAVTMIMASRHKRPTDSGSEMLRFEVAPTPLPRSLAEVGAPDVVIALRISRAEPFAPNNVVGIVDDALIQEKSVACARPAMSAIAAAAKHGICMSPAG